MSYGHASSIAQRAAQAEGGKAHADGRGKSENPYAADSSEAFYWRHGWEDAQDAAVAAWQARKESPEAYAARGGQSWEGWMSS